MQFHVDIPKNKLPAFLAFAKAFGFDFTITIGENQVKSFTQLAEAYGFDLKACEDPEITRERKEARNARDRARRAAKKAAEILG